MESRPSRPRTRPSSIISVDALAATLGQRLFRAAVLPLMAKALTLIPDAFTIQRRPRRAQPGPRRLSLKATRETLQSTIQAAGPGKSPISTMVSHILLCGGKDPRSVHGH